MKKSDKKLLKHVKRAGLTRKSFKKKMKTDPVFAASVDLIMRHSGILADKDKLNGAR